MPVFGDFHDEFRTDSLDDPIARDHGQRAGRVRGNPHENLAARQAQHARRPGEGHRDLAVRVQHHLAGVGKQHRLPLADRSLVCDRHRRRRSIAIGIQQQQANEHQRHQPRGSTGYLCPPLPGAVRHPIGCGVVRKKLGQTRQRVGLVPHGGSFDQQFAMPAVFIQPRRQGSLFARAQRTLVDFQYPAARSLEQFVVPRDRHYLAHASSRRPFAVCRFVPLAGRPAGSTRSTCRSRRYCTHLFVPLTMCVSTVGRPRSISAMISFSV